MTQHCFQTLFTPSRILQANNFSRPWKLFRKGKHRTTSAAQPDQYSISLRSPTRFQSHFPIQPARKCPRSTPISKKMHHMTSGFQDTRSVCPISYSSHLTLGSRGIHPSSRNFVGGTSIKIQNSEGDFREEYQ